MSRTPDEIMSDWVGTIHAHDEEQGEQVDTLLWEIIEDILDSIKLCKEQHPDAPPFTWAVDQVHGTVQDYVTNHYGD